MSSSSSSDPDDEMEQEQQWIFYRDRKDWKDVVPIPQDDGEDPVVRIAYTDRCKLDKKDTQRIYRLFHCPTAYLIVSSIHSSCTFSKAVSTAKTAAKTVSMSWM